MLVFLDESYEPDGSGGHRYALGGFGIDEREYRRLAAAVHQCKQKYFQQAGEMSPDEIREARRRRIVTDQPPEDAEIKADKSLTVKQARHHAEHGDAPGILLATELIAELGSRRARAIRFSQSATDGPTKVVPG